MLTLGPHPRMLVSMLPHWIIEKKRDGIALTADEIDYFVGGYARGTIPDAQMAALAMAICLRGMTAEETAALTTVMLNSGETLDTSRIPGSIIDKHSTGGIGDKISLVLAPIAACMGIAVPMISGRGLGITGGTLDKLESIPGYRTNLTQHEFLQIVGSCGCSIIGQTQQLAPADRKLYALRDVTGTVLSVPLIVASILSKKFAAGLDGLVLDVKCGSGAFMKDERSARDLALALVKVCKQKQTAVAALITNMDQPIGHSAGNALEVVEAIQCLRGNGPDDVLELGVLLSAEMAVLGNTCPDKTSATALARAQVQSGAALDKFGHMLDLHGADLRILDKPDSLLTARYSHSVRSTVTGAIHSADAGAIGRACLLLGAGRSNPSDTVDHAVGISHIRKVGEQVSCGETLAVLHANNMKLLSDAIPQATNAFVVRDESAGALDLILGTV